MAKEKSTYQRWQENPNKPKNTFHPNLFLIIKICDLPAGVMDKSFKLSVLDAINTWEIRRILIKRLLYIGLCDKIAIALYAMK